MRSLLLCLALASVAHADTFDVVTYAAPSGWTKTQTADGVQLSTTDKDESAIAVITRATPTTGTPEQNFASVWDKAVKAKLEVDVAPAQQPSILKGGWTLVAGSATPRGGKGIAVLISATGYGKSVSLIAMTNTTRYQTELLAFVRATDILAPGATSSDRRAFVGKQWESATPQTASYRFAADGSYTFAWMSADSTVIDRERGVYTYDGAQVAIVPMSGTTDEYTPHWGTRVKSTPKKRDTIIYALSIDRGALVLRNAKEQVRLADTAKPRPQPAD